MSQSRRRTGPSSPPPRGFPGWLAILLMLAFVTLVAAIPYVVASQDARRPPLEEALTTLPLPAGMTLDDLQRARVTDIIDGDTIRVTIDGTIVVVRYFGIDAPERNERCYRESLDRHRKLLEGGVVLLLPDQRRQDAFGRELRYVFLPNGISVDATLVAEGFAEAWRQDGRYRDEIVALEEQARAAGRGCLW